GPLSCLPSCFPSIRTLLQGLRCASVGTPSRPLKLAARTRGAAARPAALASLSNGRPCYDGGSALRISREGHKGASLTPRKWTWPAGGPQSREPARDEIRWRMNGRTHRNGGRRHVEAAVHKAAVLLVPDTGA